MRSAAHLKFTLAAVLCLAGCAFSADEKKDEKKGDEKPVTVIVTPSGTKYHVEGCTHCGKDAKAIPLTEAKGKYEACADCKPDATVYVTKTGEKFHCKDCSHAKDGTSMTLAEAVSKGFKACKTCNPPDGKKEEKKEKKDDKKKDEKKDDEKKDPNGGEMKK